MKKKKILLIATNDLGKSGAPEVIMQIVRLLHESYIFDVVITRNNSFYKEEFESYGGSVFGLFEKDYKNWFFRLIYKTIVLRMKIRKFMKGISSNDYCAIHSFKDLEGGYYLKCAKKTGINNRISHSSRQYVKPKKLLSQIRDKIFLKEILKNATQLVSVSHLAGSTLFKNNDFKVIHNTYNESLYQFEQNQNYGNLVLLQVASFQPIKNQLFSIEVMRMIVNSIPKAQLFLIGNISNYEYYKSVVNLVEKYKLKENVCILDYDTNQEKIFNRVSYTLTPSIYEGLSLTTIESQAKGITCFASTGVPCEVSCGNVIFLELEPILWSKKIIDLFSKNRGARKKVNMTKFSNALFKKKMETIYSKNR